MEEERKEGGRGRRKGRKEGGAGGDEDVLFSLYIFDGEEGGGGKAETIKAPRTHLKRGSS